MVIRIIFRFLACSPVMLLLEQGRFIEKGS